ncbi:tautomerase family protein [Hydrogenophaga sp. BPS33]|nr:tautomerase family protein [Hydrogenophaga sp. BPS33]
MPFARISLLRGKSPEYVRMLADRVHQALVEAFEVPLDDRFQAIHQHERDELVFDQHYLGGPRSDNYVLVCITAGRMRSTKVKQSFYRHLTNLLSESPGVPPEDVMVVINTTQADEWSFGSGKSIVAEE